MLLCPADEDCVVCPQRNALECKPHHRAAKRHARLEALVSEIHVALLGRINNGGGGLIDRIRRLELIAAGIGGLGGLAAGARALGLWGGP